MFWNEDCLGFVLMLLLWMVVIVENRRETMRQKPRSIRILDVDSPQQLGETDYVHAFAIKPEP